MRAGLFLLGVATGIIGSLYFVQNAADNSPVKIIQETRTITKWKYLEVPTNPIILKECYISPIIIETIPRDSWIDITAYDNCKKAEKSIKVGQTTNWRYYVGFAAIGAIAGGYLSFKFMK